MPWSITGFGRSRCLGRGTPLSHIGKNRSSPRSGCCARPPLSVSLSLAPRPKGGRGAKDPEIGTRRNVAFAPASLRLIQLSSDFSGAPPPFRGGVALGRSEYEIRSSLRSGPPRGVPEAATQRSRSSLRSRPPCPIHVLKTEGRWGAVCRGVGGSSCTGSALGGGCREVTLLSAGYASRGTARTSVRAVKATLVRSGGSGWGRGYPEDHSWSVTQTPLWGPEAGMPPHLR